MEWFFDGIGTAIVTLIFGRAIYEDNPDYVQWIE